MVAAKGSEPGVTVGLHGEAMAAWFGLRRIPEQALEVPCEPVVKAAVLTESRIAPRRPKSSTPACSSTGF